MRIGIDASSLIQKKTGIGNFASGLFGPLRDKAAGKHELFFYQPPAQADLSAPRRIFWEAFQLPAKAHKDRVDLVYSPGFSPPPARGFKTVVTVHDVIGLIYPKNVGLVSRWYWSRWLPGNIRRAGIWVASSESTRRDMEKYLRIPQKSVRVVPLAANPLFRKLGAGADGGILRKYGIDRPFLISVGTLEPRKNGLRLVRAFAELAKSQKELLLVMAGKDGGLLKDILRFVRDNDIAERVLLPGYVPDEDLVNLYNAALGYAMISLYEGFGLPALEAMNCGLTGIVSSCSSLPEVVGNTAWLVDPKDVAAITQAMRALILDPDKTKALAVNALKRAREFSYEKTADQMMDIFEKA